MDPIKDHWTWEGQVLLAALVGASLILSEGQAGEVIIGIVLGYFLPPLYVDVVNRRVSGELGVGVAGVLIAASWAADISAYFITAFVGALLLGAGKVRRYNDRTRSALHRGEVNTLGSTDDKHKPLSGMPL